jgi:hypothetical protein
LYEISRWTSGGLPAIWRGRGGERSAVVEDPAEDIGARAVGVRVLVVERKWRGSGDTPKQRPKCTGYSEQRRGLAGLGKVVQRQQGQDSGRQGHRNVCPGSCYSAVDGW